MLLANRSNRATSTPSILTPTDTKVHEFLRDLDPRRSAYSRNATSCVSGFWSLFFDDTRAYEATLISLFSRPSNICLLALQSQALSVVDGIAAKLMETPYNVRVEGHTDDIPIKTAQFPSNLELSTSRATHVLKHLIQSGGIPPSRLSAVGYGEYRPVASNRTRDGRGLNRRVDIVVLSMIAEKFEPKRLAAIAAPPSAPPAPLSVLPAEAPSPPAAGHDD